MKHCRLRVSRNRKQEVLFGFKSDDNSAAENFHASILLLKKKVRQLEQRHSATLKCKTHILQPFRTVLLHCLCMSRISVVEDKISKCYTEVI